MPVELIKRGARIIDGLLIHPDKVSCDRCAQSYEFHYSPSEEHRVKEWLPKAQVVVNKSHSHSHPDSLTVPY
jgi:hypothetical protein